MITCSVVYVCSNNHDSVLRGVLCLQQLGTCSYDNVLHGIIICLQQLGALSSNNSVFTYYVPAKDDLASSDNTTHFTVAFSLLNRQASGSLSVCSYQKTLAAFI